MANGSAEARSALDNALENLSDAKVRQLLNIVRCLAEPCKGWASKEFGEQFADEFCALLQLHHGTSSEPFRKDKFEFGMVQVLQAMHRDAQLAPAGNPGHDMTVDGVPWSLKTQANTGIRGDVLWISKFMELGKGRWEEEEDLIGLRQQMFDHMEAYDRILTLRCLTPSGEPLFDSVQWRYELVEIPKKTLFLAKDSDVEMMHTSTQHPKPGYCRVHDDAGELIFALYFDGGSERKLQIKDLNKNWCEVHGTWKFTSLDGQ